MLGQNQFGLSGLLITSALKCLPSGLFQSHCIWWEQFFRVSTAEMSLSMTWLLFSVTRSDTCTFGRISGVTCLHNGMTDYGKSSLTGKSPSAECDVSHFTSLPPSFPTFGGPLPTWSPAVKMLCSSRQKFNNIMTTHCRWILYCSTCKGTQMDLTNCLPSTACRKNRLLGCYRPR